jgi:ketosteroid isomerase-like protein
MAEHPNAALFRRLTDGMNTGDMDVIFASLDPDVEWHEIGRAEPIRGLQALSERYADANVDFTIKTSVHDVVGNDEHVVALVNAEADRNGKHLSYRTAEIAHVKDGKVTARWAFSDDTQAIIDFFA